MLYTGPVTSRACLSSEGAFPRALGLRHGLDQNRRCQDWGTDGHYELVFGPRNQHEEHQWSYLRRLGGV